MRPVPLHDASEPDLANTVVSEVLGQTVSAVVGAVPPADLAVLRELMDHAVEADAAQLPPHLYEQEYGRIVFLGHYGRPFLDLLANPVLMDPIDQMLGPDSILWSMTTACKPPGGTGRTFHTDREYVRVPGFQLSVGILVLLDDFTLESGPTRFHPDLCEDEPSAEEFEEQGLYLEAPAGSACWFHRSGWHDAPDNHSDQWRRAILIAMTRPFVRQRFDMARMVAHLDPETFSPRVRQKMGFDLLLPGSYEEFYLPHETRQQELLRRAVRRA